MENKYNYVECLNHSAILLRKMEEIIYKQIKFYKIKDFKDYFISKCGKILSTVKYRGTDMRILIPYIASHKYLALSLRKNKKDVKILLHRLIAKQFISNPENKPCINHIDGNRINNSLNNLEWCTYSENNTHSYRILNKIPPMKGRFGKLNPGHKKINQYDLKNRFIKKWDSIADVERKLKINHANISTVCLGGRNHAGGFIWRYANE